MLAVLMKQESVYSGAEGRRLACGTVFVSVCVDDGN